MILQFSPGCTQIMLPLPALFWDYRLKLAHLNCYHDTDIKMHAPTLYLQSL